MIDNGYHIIGLGIIAIAFAVWLILRLTPITIPLRFLIGKSPNVEQPFKFVNSAPSAPDFETAHRHKAVTKQATFVHHPLPSNTHKPDTYSQPAFNLSDTIPAFEREMSALLMYMTKLVQVKYHKEGYLLVYRHGKLLGIVLCVQQRRVNRRYLDKLVDMRDKLNLKTAYLITTGVLEIPAKRIAIREQVQVINKHKLQRLRNRYKDLKDMEQFRQGAIEL